MKRRTYLVSEVSVLLASCAVLLACVFGIVRVLEHRVIIGFAATLSVLAAGIGLWKETRPSKAGPEKVSGCEGQEGSRSNQ